MPSLGAKPTIAASRGSAESSSDAIASPGRAAATRSISAEGDNAARPAGSTVITPGLSASRISSSKLSMPPVTPTSASTTPAVMPRNQWTWKTALRNVVVINQNSTLSDSHRRRPASLVLRLLA